MELFPKNSFQVTIFVFINYSRIERFNHISKLDMKWKNNAKWINYRIANPW